MKASVTFRDEQPPLAMAKVPISILSLPFTAGASTSSLPSDLRLDLSTAFPSGPSLRLSYRPNIPSSPFSLRLKSGLGLLGSPRHAPFSMSAEFLLPSHPHSSPTFTVLLKPRLGDFHVKRLTQSPPLLGIGSKTAVETDPPVIEFGDSAPWKANRNAAAKMFSGVEISARSELPLWSGANVQFRWGVKLPQEGKMKMPVMVMSKVSVEHLPVVACKKKGDENHEMVEMCKAVTRQVEGMKEENGMLRKAVEELRMDVGGGRLKEVSGLGAVRNGTGDVRSGGGVVKKADVKVPDFVAKLKAEEEELKKALRGKIGGGN